MTELPAWVQILIWIISILFGNGVIGAILVFFLKQVHGRIDTLSKEVTTLKDDKVKSIEVMVNEHIKEDQSQKILTKLDVMSGSVSKFGDKVDRLAEETARQGATIKDSRNYLESLRDNIRELRRQK